MESNNLKLASKKVASLGSFEDYCNQTLNWMIQDEEDNSESERDVKQWKEEEEGLKEPLIDWDWDWDYSGSIIRRPPFG